ncbi:MAG: amino acid ABC transporter permease [Chloroflexota bacterium]|nr:amino acid ABC transporter permease [Chloroflexota bacterium]
MSGVAPATPPELAGHRGSRLLDFGRGAGGGAVVALVSTVIVFGLIGYVVITSPGWEAVHRQFFSSVVFDKTFPGIAKALWKNIQLFLLAEVFILMFGLVLAVMRNLPGPAFFPLRLMSIVYTDIFRGLPSILVIYVIGFGVPGLRIPGLTNDVFVLGMFALVLCWSAYVAEVYRAGILSVHPSQDAAARSLGLSRLQALRYVVLPQAVRRVIPPLLNDFIGLQKDTALVSTIGVIEVFRQTQNVSGAGFNLTPFLACGLLFLVMTIPMTRFVDWLVARDRRRQLAGAAR